MSSEKTPWTVRSFPLASIANHVNLRCDAKYRLFWGVTGDALFPDSKVANLPIAHATAPLRIRKLKKGGLANEYELVELEDVEQRTGFIQSSTAVSEIQSDKLLFGDADILTTRLRPYLGKTICNDRTKQLAGTTEWIPLKIRYDRLHPILLKYFLLSPRYVDNAGRLLSGKEHPRIAESDILALRVPFFSEETQRLLIRQITAFEKKIEAAREILKAEQDIIDQILCSAFKYPLEEHRARARVKYYLRTVSKLAGSFTLRNSSRFHHPDYDLIEQFFAAVPHEPLKRYIKVPIRLGATANKRDFIEDGEVYYVHPGATKNQGSVRLEDCYRVDQRFAKAARRSALQHSDIVLNRAGEGTIGKVAIFDSDEPAICSDFTMRVRLTPAKLLPRFGLYYLRSIMFQAQVEREKRGMGNMTNIFPAQVERMLVVQCSPELQRELAQQIDAELETLRKARKTVHDSISRIHDTIQKATLNAATSSLPTGSDH